MIMQTEFEFTLPRGFVDGQGQVHRHGRMRLATAVDEIEAVEHPQVQAKESYLPVILLSRVVTQLGALPEITPQTIAGLFASDISHLQDLYLRLNSSEPITIGVVCPYCNHELQLQVAPLG
ncbi:MAG: phage tail assembly protein [Chloroflexi bacterium]|nr:phage tail assembly protein [Chloroflexota bacterium]MBK6709773.1 phage tail assembly protein [Chloroflexota bacterium]MBK7179909.1 phage tail assembly protein [Chloroflexota bacterium]MBK7918619.1 phage tail assembly protein [Chloroflexota bacterium]MBK8932719.1 phage tail assembly protein [Chloroflexota bacterium]